MSFTRQLSPDEKPRYLIDFAGSVLTDRFGNPVTPEIPEQDGLEGRWFRPGWVRLIHSGWRVLIVHRNCRADDFTERGWGQFGTWDSEVIEAVVPALVEGQSFGLRFISPNLWAVEYAPEGIEPSMTEDEVELERQKLRAAGLLP